MNRRRGTNPRAVGRAPRQRATNPRAVGTNPRAARSPAGELDEPAAIDGRLVRTTIARALRSMRLRDLACVGCGGRSTLDLTTSCTCEPVSYREAVEHLAERRRRAVEPW